MFILKEFIFYLLLAVFTSFILRVIVAYQYYKKRSPTRFFLTTLLDAIFEVLFSWKLLLFLKKNDMRTAVENVKWVTTLRDFDDNNSEMFFVKAYEAARSSAKDTKTEVNS
jgi:hypothetical protein